MRRREEGASALMIAVVLVLVVVAVLASRVLSRLGDAGEDKNNTLASLARAQAALDQFVIAGGPQARLPCPADQGIDETPPTPPNVPSPLMGLEQRNGVNDCQFPTGTLPWRTIGLRRDDAYDAWGRKLSYRVYIANKGSFVQERGPSLLDCFDDGTGGPGKGVDSDGLCKSDHTTYKSAYGLGGLSLTDMNPPTRNDVAYVVMSHGPTGLGGYSASGAVVVTESHHGPKGHENQNTTNNGPFYIDPWSKPDIAADDPSHFDDLLVYRTIGDLIAKAGLTPRNWPIAGLTFNAATVGTAFGGGNATPGSTASGGSVSFGSATATASGGSGARISYDEVVSDSLGNKTGGIGVSSGGSSTAISSTFNEQIRFDLPLSSAQIAVTLNNFGTYVQTVPLLGSLTFVDQVQFTFYNKNTQVAQVQKSACNATPTMASFALTLNPGVTFDRVDIKPLSATVGGIPAGDTSFYISALFACRAGVSCTSPLATPANTCS